MHRQRPNTSDTTCGRRTGNGPTWCRPERTEQRLTCQTQLSSVTFTLLLGTENNRALLPTGSYSMGGVKIRVSTSPKNSDARLARCTELKAWATSQAEVTSTTHTFARVAAATLVEQANKKQNYSCDNSVERRTTNTTDHGILINRFGAANCRGRRDCFAGGLVLWLTTPGLGC